MKKMRISNGSPLAAWLRGSVAAILTSMMLTASPARALDLDWSGDFWAENHWINNYRMNSANATSGGYSIPGPDKTAQFQTLFFRLKPRVIVNDNVYLHSELWFGSPAYGVFGDAPPLDKDRRSFNSTLSGGGVVSAQRFWAEVLTDVGNLHVGRAPLHWGLGLVWNSGDGLFNRFQSTGDLVRLMSRFGAFSVGLASIKYTTGGSVLGNNLSDYSASLKYDNQDEDFEVGVNFLRRVGGGYVSFGDPDANSDVNTTTWDVFTRKKFGKLELSAEAPIVSGKVSGVEYSTYALALEGKYDLSDAWNFSTKLGHVPGQNGDQSKYRGFFLHPNYKLGLILFNYQLANLAGTNAGVDANGSAFNAPITNAKYLQLSGDYTRGKWQFRGSWIYALANETAGTTGTFYNHWDRDFQTAGGSVAQGSSLGWELDLGATLQWDDHFEFRADAGIFMPGDFFKYTATDPQNQTGTVAAVVFGLGTRF